VQAEDAGQATLVRMMLWPPGGLGVGWMRQVAPFHRSARVPWSDPPAARQAEGPVQDTPARDANWTPGGLGVGWMRQVAPFHRSARVCTIPAAECRSPMAVQAEGEVQDTPFRKLCTAPAGLGVGRMVHFLPFHRSARDRAGPDWDAVVKYAPVAMQADGEVQDTASRKLCTALAGFGVGWMVQVVPFHRSARVLPFAVPPTAVQAEREGHHTLFSPPPPAGLGVGWIRQMWPFHCSASVTMVRDLLVVAPTAVQAERAVQATPLRELDAAPGGLGAAWVRHVVPADRSTRTAGDWLVLEYPTAVQAAAEVQARPISRLGPWLGVAWRCQVVPFQCSARVWEVPELLT